MEKQDAPQKHHSTVRQPQAKQCCKEELFGDAEEII